MNPEKIALTYTARVEKSKNQIWNGYYETQFPDFAGSTSNFKLRYSKYIMEAKESAKKLLIHLAHITFIEKEPMPAHAYEFDQGKKIELIPVSLTWREITG